jgi:sodium/potassium-transporting ATPase subunit alpha
LGDPNPAPVNLALAVILMFVVFLQAIFNAWQDWSTNKVMNGINNMLPTHTLVLRDGKQTTINALDLVTGDVVYIKMGNKVPADVRLIQVSDDLRFDRSILTGESEPIAGSVDATDPNFLETQNIAMMGTHCVNGSATGIVIGTGDSTMMGKIARLSAANTNQRTLLQIEILRFVLIIAGLSISVGIICLIAWAAWLRVDFPTYLTLPNALIDVISVIVAFVPEGKLRYMMRYTISDCLLTVITLGMPVAVTLCLTLIANRMAKNNVLCKVLTTVETLGSVNVICCDKTGTITCNKMFATNASIADQLLTAKECVDITNSNGQSPILSAVRQLHLAATLCTNASFDSSTIEYPVAQRKVNGDATDSAVLVFAENMEDTTKTKSQFEKVFEIPFNSKNKWMLTLSRPKSEKTAEALEIGLTTDDYIIYTKGAPDVLFSRCSSVMLPDGSIDVFSDTRQKQIVELQTQWATEGKRVLALTRRIIKKEDIPHNITPGTNQFGKYVNDENKNLTIVGLLAIVDPPRDESAHTIAVCRKAGIRFFMVTGGKGAGFENLWSSSFN